MPRARRFVLAAPFLPVLLLVYLLAGSSRATAAETPLPEQILPPELPWAGKSWSLALPADHPWATPAERALLLETPRYDETLAYLQRLDAASKQLTLRSIGKSPEGREIWMAIVAANGAATAEALRASGKPLLLAHGGIHAGEIDGKDAGLMLLRDLTVTGRAKALLEKVNLLFIPILNVDGHERFGLYHRVNQRGPRQMGWRTNARNLNLNRDFAKLDTPEVRAVVGVIERFAPDLYFDLHVTDGADYQYDVTYGWTGPFGHSPAGAGWLDGVLRPALDRGLAAAGHVPGPLVFLVDDRDPGKGNLNWTADPRFSNGYGDLRHLPTVLVENHSLKPYPQRVLGTYVLLESAMAVLGERGQELRAAIAADRSRRRDPVPLTWKLPAEPPPRVPFLGVASTLELSAVSGNLRQRWTGQAIEVEVPLLTNSAPEVTVARPRAYWVPAEYPEVIERLRLHGLELETLQAPREVMVELDRLEEPTLADEPFEGHVRLTARAVPELRRETYAPGSVRVATDQPLGNLAVILLEPASPDSFLQWGFFHEILQRTEYVEAYAVEALAEQMLAADPALAAEFQERLASDPKFAASREARLDFFYRKTPYRDDRWRLYPVGRELAPAEEK